MEMMKEKIKLIVASMEAINNYYENYRYCRKPKYTESLKALKEILETDYLSKINLCDKQNYSDIKNDTFNKLIHIIYKDGIKGTLLFKDPIRHPLDKFEDEKSIFKVKEAGKRFDHIFKDPSTEPEIELCKYFEFITDDNYTSKLFYHITILIYANFKRWDEVESAYSIDCSSEELSCFQGTQIPFDLQKPDWEEINNAIEEFSIFYKKHPHMVNKFDDFVDQQGGYLEPEAIKDIISNKISNSKMLIGLLFHHNDMYKPSHNSLIKSLDCLYCFNKLVFKDVDMDFYKTVFNYLTYDRIKYFISTYEDNGIFYYGYEGSEHYYFKAQRYGVNILKLVNYLTTKDYQEQVLKSEEIF